GEVVDRRRLAVLRAADPLGEQVLDVRFSHKKYDRFALATDFALSAGRWSPPPCAILLRGKVLNRHNVHGIQSRDRTIPVQTGKRMSSDQNELVMRHCVLASIRSAQ